MIEASDGVVDEVIADLKQVAGREQRLARKMLPRYVALSSDVRYIRDHTKTLFIVGAFKTSRLSKATEVWLYATKHLKPAHMREVRELWQNWLSEQSGLLFARANCPESSRMLKFLGFTFIAETAGVEIYRTN